MRELEKVKSMYSLPKTRKRILLSLHDNLNSIIIEGDDGCVYLTNIFKNPHSISMVESLLNSFKSDLLKVIVTEDANWYYKNILQKMIVYQRDINLNKILKDV